MSTIVVEDVCLWPKHIDANPELQRRLLGLRDGEIVILKIGSKSGAFRKMAQGKNAQPTPGLRPACDASRDWWRQVFEERKGARLPIREIVE